MMRSRSAVLAAVLWSVAMTWMVALPDQERAHRLLLSVAIAATTVAAIDRHAAQFREVVRLTLHAASYGQPSRVSATERHADNRE